MGDLALSESSLLARLDRDGPDATDGRRAVLAITDAGRKMAADRRSVSVQRVAAAIDEEFTPAERRELLAMLALLDRLAERL